MKQSTKNFITGLFFICGLFLANFFNIQNNFVIIVLVFTLIFILIFHKRKIIHFFYILISILLGILLLNYTKIWYYNNEILDFKNNKKTKFIGRIIDEPDKRIDKQKIKISAIRILEPNNVKISGNTLATIKLYPPYNYGDVVETTCILTKPGKIEDFDYARYLSKDNIYSLCYDANIRLLEKDKGNIFIHQIYKIKKFLFENVNSIWPEPISSFANSSLFGFEKLLPADIDEDFRHTGLSHIVVVSGMHVAIIIVVFSKILYKIKINRKQSFLFLFILLFTFAILSGLSASIIRASIMGILVVFSKNIERYIPNHLVLVYSLIIMAVINPLSIFYDIGFQLSFLATVGLIYISPILINYLKFIPDFFSLREIVSTSLSAIAMTLPISLYNFHTLPIFALLSNIIILPFITFDMALYVLTILASLINMDIARYMGFVSYMLTKALFWIVKIISNIKISVLDISHFTIFHMLFFYILIFLFYLYAKKENSQNHI